MGSREIAGDTRREQLISEAWGAKMLQSENFAGGSMILFLNCFCFFQSPGQRVGDRCHPCAVLRYIS